MAEIAPPENARKRITRAIEPHDGLISSDVKFVGGVPRISGGNKFTVNTEMHSKKKRKRIDMTFIIQPLVPNK